MKVYTSLLILLALGLSPLTATAGSSDQPVGNKGNQLVGIRIGAYHFTTEEKLSLSKGLEVSGGSKDAVTAELFYNYFVLDQLAFELSLGNSSRSDITFKSDEIGEFFGTVNVYPIALGVKLTPLSGIVHEHFQPYVHGGGSLVITREIFEGIRSIDLEEYLDRGGEQSSTDFGWWAGAGFESYVSSRICVTSNFKYHAIDYSESIGGYKNHSGYQIMVGVAYIFRKKTE